MNRLCAVIVAVGVGLVSCTPAVEEEPVARSSSALVGVPQDGYPSWDERLMLVAINRTRADPNNVSAGTAGKLTAYPPNVPCPEPCSGTKSASCFTSVNPQKPLMHNHNGCRAARFHCNNLLLNQGGLSHNSYCTLRNDVGTTNCDGSRSCACTAGTEAFNCTTSGGRGTGFGTRCSYFGFSASGEVGAVGYGDGWGAVGAWVTECADYEGHRMILTSGGYSQIGLGASRAPAGMSPAPCWQTFYFGDTAGGNITTATLPSGVHRPRTGSATTSFSFYVNYYATGAPQSVSLVLDGKCIPMSKELGVTDSNATYLVQQVVGAGCHQYWFLARDNSGRRVTWPEAGAWGVGDNVSCDTYSATATPADCDGDAPDAGVGAPDAGRPDAAGLDAGRPDAAGLDAGRPDAAGLDAGRPDAAGLDAAGLDAAGVDAAGLDAAGLDAAGLDAAGLDAAGLDAARPDAAPVPLDAATVPPDAAIAALDARVASDASDSSDASDLSDASDNATPSPDADIIPEPPDAAFGGACGCTSQAGAPFASLLLLSLISLGRRARR